MQRREFLTKAGLTSLGISLRPRFVYGQASNSFDAWITLIEKEIPVLLRHANVPGMSIAIIENGRLRWRRGFGIGDMITRKPVDVETAFAAASMSKPVFAYAVMKLVEKGVLDLDTPLTKYSSEKILAGDPRLDLITTREVLCHTTGLAIGQRSLANRVHPWLQVQLLRRGL